VRTLVWVDAIDREFGPAADGTEAREDHVIELDRPDGPGNSSPAQPS
jgi:hypothetical protein